MDTIQDVWLAQDFHHPPVQLLPAPACIIGTGQRRAARPPRLVAPDAGDPPDHSSALPLTSPAAPPAPKAKRRQQPKKACTAQESPALVRDSCAGDPRRVGHCRLRLPDGRVAALPLSPSDFCRDLGDDEHELVVVEMQASPGAAEVAWLEDESVSVVLVAGKDSTTEVPRESLRAHVRRRVPLRPCTRDLRRAVYVLCQPQGSEGPMLTLVPAADALTLAAAAS